MTGKGWHWLYRGVLCLLVFAVLWWNFLDRFPAPVFHAIWAGVTILGALTAGPPLYARGGLELPRGLRFFAAGLLLGAALTSVRWEPVDGRLYTNLTWALVPLLTYSDLVLASGRRSARTVADS